MQSIENKIVNRIYGTPSFGKSFDTRGKTTTREPKVSTSKSSCRFLFVLAFHFPVATVFPPPLALVFTESHLSSLKLTQGLLSVNHAVKEGVFLDDR